AARSDRSKSGQAAIAAHCNRLHVVDTIAISLAFPIKPALHNLASGNILLRGFCCPDVALGGFSMPKETLNDRALKALKPAKKGTRYERMDKVVPGFGIRVTDKGAKTFILIARYPGSTNPTRRALGEYGAITLEKARQKARDWLEVIERGADPAEQEERERQAEQQKRENTFAAVAEDFIAEKLPGERKGKEVEREIRREFLPALGNLPITDVTDLQI